MTDLRELIQLWLTRAKEEREAADREQNIRRLGYARVFEQCAHDLAKALEKK